MTSNSEITFYMYAKSKKVDNDLYQNSGFFNNAV